MTSVRRLPVTFEVTGDRSPKGEGNRQASEALLAGRPVDREVMRRMHAHHRRSLKALLRLQVVEERLAPPGDY